MTEESYCQLPNYEEKTNHLIKLAYAINEITDQQIVSGSIAQTLYLGFTTRPATDLDIILPKNIVLTQNIGELSNILNKDYTLSSNHLSTRGGYRFKLMYTQPKSQHNTREYISIDVKNLDELYTMKANLKLIKLERLIANKLATTLIGDGKEHYIRIKDFYDLAFLLESLDFNDDEVFIYLANRLINNNILDINDTFLFSPNSIDKYLDIYHLVKNKYQFQNNINLFKAKLYLKTHTFSINNAINYQKTC